jgi:hypothetical protein
LYGAVKGSQGGISPSLPDCERCVNRDGPNSANIWVKTVPER